MELACEYSSVFVFVTNMLVSLILKGVHPKQQNEGADVRNPQIQFSEDPCGCAILWGTGCCNGFRLF